VFLGYSSCHLGYRCFDLSSDRIYISCHVRFHEHSFSFLESDHVSATTNSNPQLAPISHLLTLTYFPSHNPPQTTTLPTHTSISLPLFATMSLDHFTGLGSTAPNITTYNSPLSAAPPAFLSSPVSPSWVPTQSSLILDLCVDLSSYSIP
jgi:hypothetical protein